MTPTEEKPERSQSDIWSELDQDTEKHFPAPDEARKVVVEGDLKDFPEWFKRAYLLMARIEHAAHVSQKLRTALRGLSSRMEAQGIEVEGLLRELCGDFDLVELRRHPDSGDMSDSGAQLYRYLGVETRLEAILMAFDREAMKIEELIRAVCYTPQWLAGQPLSTLMARYLDYRRDYRQYLETAITEGRQDRVREQGLRDQWMSHISLIGMTVNELSQRLEMVGKRREREHAELEQRDRKPNPPEQASKTTGKSLKDYFTFNLGQALFKGKDLDLPSGEPITMLGKLIEHFGCLVPYKDFDKNYTSATPGTVYKSKREIVKCFEKHKVPCEITFKTGAGYIIRERKPVTKRKKRVRKK